MNSPIILIPVPLDEFISRLKSELVPVIPVPNPVGKTDDEFLTIGEVSKLLGVSKVSLHKWKKNGKIKFYRFGSRIRFKKSEILQVGKYK